MMKIKDLIQNGFAQLYQFLQTQNKYFYYKRLIKEGLLVLGKHTYGIPDIQVYKGSERKVVIGNFCSIGQGVVMITGGIHPTNRVSTFPFRIKWNLAGAYQDGMPSSDGDIVIGSDVWIGAESLILSGVTIGHGAIVAARSVVTRDVPPYAVVVGTPASAIRYRFDQEVIQKLLETEWWEKDDRWIMQNIDLLTSERIDEFLQMFAKQEMDVAS